MKIDLKKIITLKIYFKITYWDLKVYLINILLPNSSFYNIINITNIKFNIINYIFAFNYS